MQQTISTYRAPAWTALGVAVALLATSTIAEAAPHLRRTADLRLQVNDVSALTSGNFDSDGAEELALAAREGGDRLALLLYDTAAGATTRIGDVRLSGTSIGPLASADFDEDGLDEVAVAVKQSDGGLAVLWYDAPRAGAMTRIGDVRLQGTSIAALAAGQLDGDPRLELVVAVHTSGGGLAVLIYDFAAPNDLRRSGDLRLQGDGITALTTGNFDSDPADELAFAVRESSGNFAVLLYDTGGSGPPTRIGDVRLQALHIDSVAAGNFDADPRQELALSLKTGHEQIAVLLYDVEGPQSLRRIGDVRLRGRASGWVLAGNLNDEPTDEVIVGLEQLGGEPMFRVYEVFAPNVLRQAAEERLQGTRLDAGTLRRTTDGAPRFEVALSLEDDGGTSATLLYELRTDLNYAEGDRPVLVLCWDPSRPGHPAPPIADVQELLFGATHSVAGYYAESSGGRVRLTNAGVLGWLPARYPWQLYWREGAFAIPTDPNHPNYHVDPDGNPRYLDAEGFYGGHSHSWAEALRAADNQFDFSRYDTNGDGALAPQELSVVMVVPQNRPSGVRRSLVARHVPLERKFMVDGVRIFDIAVAYLGAPTDDHVGLVAEELGHLMFNLPDVYFQNGARRFTVPYEALGLSLTTAGNLHPHLDGYQRSKLGWVTRQPILRDGRYSLRDAATSREALTIHHPDRGRREYFLLENRWPGTSYDEHLADRGLAIWHIVEDPEIYRGLPAPPGVAAMDWQIVGADEWGRRGLRLVRPTAGTGLSDTLWDGSDPATGYDIVATASAGRTILRWVDGSATGITIRDLSAAGPEISFSVSLPWDGTGQ